MIAFKNKNENVILGC